MRRLASEVIKNLEMRIARAEKQSKDTGLVSPRDRRVVLRNSIMDNKRSGTVYALEFTTGKSHKFYEIIVDGDKVTTNFGSIGTKGQSQTKSYDDNDEAMEVAKVQYKAKRKKGYIDIFDSMRNNEAIGKYSPKGYDPYGTIMGALNNNRAIETSTESEINSVWPTVSYQGDEKFFDHYTSSWIGEISREELPEGMDTDLEDGMFNVYQISNTQECYLGYNQQKDIFVMGFDAWLDSEDQHEAYEEHLSAVSQYDSDYEDYMDPDMDEEYEPDQYDYKGYDEYWEDNEPETILGSAIVAFKVKDGKISQIINTEVFSERFYGGNGNYDSVKRKYSLVDLRLD